MATLAPGVVMNLIDCMNIGVKPTSEHRNSLLQVTDIVPAELDEKNLWPKHGFFIKVSDSSHSIYVTLPYEHDDLVLSNKMQLGQFIYVDRFEPGSPVPVIKGTKTIPGRHPVVSTPEPVRVSENVTRNVNRRRGSWGSAPLDLDQLTPLKKTTPMKRGRTEKTSPGVRCSVPGLAIPKTTMDSYRAESPLIRRSCGAPILGKSVEPIINPREQTQSPILNRKSCVAPSSTALKVRKSNRVAEREDVGNSRTNLNPAVKKKTATVSFNLNECEIQSSSKPRIDPMSNHCNTNLPTMKKMATDSFNLDECETQNSSNPKIDPMTNHCNTNLPTMSLPGKLSTLGKVAVQQRETAQKIALQSLRNATAMETIVRSLMMFSNLSKSAKPDSPTPCFHQFLEFHSQIMQAITDMASLQAATETNADEDMGIPWEQVDVEQKNSSQRKYAVGIAERSDQKVKMTAGTILRPILNHNDENRKPRTLGGAVKLGKMIESETSNWFMDFLEKTLEMGMVKKKSFSNGSGGEKNLVDRVPQSLILKVVNWLQVEQCDATTKGKRIHARAAQVARMLRIKMKNPWR